MSKLTVLIISANSETFPMPVSPLALPRLAGMIERAGHAARQYDVLVHGAESLPRVLQETRPDVVALSVRNVDNIDVEAPRTYIDDNRELITMVRKLSKAPIVLGGSGFSLFPRQIMHLLEPDFGVVGPGEDAFRALLDALSNGRTVEEIPNLITGDTLQGTRPGHELSPVFASDGTIGEGKHDPEMVRHYWREGGMIGLQTKRGCPRRCSYCTYPLIDGRTLHYAEPQASADEMERLFRDYGVRYFFVVDSVFNLNAEHELAFAEELCRRGLPLNWGAFFAPTGADGAYWHTLKRSGLTHVELGTDSLSDTMLASYQKGFTVDEAMRTTATCADVGLFCAHYIIFGGPGETPDTIRETVANAERLPRCVLFPFAGVRVYPRTSVYADAMRQGRITEEDDCLAPTFYFAEGLDARRAWEILNEGTCHNHEWVMPSRYPTLERMMRHLRRQGTKGPLWEFLLR